MQVEDLYFLGRFHTGAELAQVVQLAAFRRPQEVEAVTGRIEVRLANERRHQRQCQQQDQPRRIDQQADGQAGDGDRILHLAEQLAHQVHPAHGLAPRTVQLVLQVRVLEVLQVQGGCVFHQAHAGDVGEQFRQQGIGVADQAAEQVRGDGQAQFQRQQAEQRVEQPTGQRLAQRREARVVLAEVQRGIDDQLADVQHRHRQQRTDQAQAKAGDGQGAAGLPHLAQERRQVAHRLEALTQAGFLGAGSAGNGGSRHAAIVRA
ncbi:hypothetical protein D3C81_1186750 [compost metagenome]